MRKKFAECRNCGKTGLLAVRTSKQGETYKDVMNAFDSEPDHVVSFGADIIACSDECYTAIRAGK